MPSPDLLDFAPERLVDPLPRPTLAERLRTASGFGLVSLALNLGVVVWLARVGWPLRPAEATAPISVEIVDRMPGESGRPGSSGARTAAADGTAGGGTRQVEAEAPQAPPNQPKAPDGAAPSDKARSPEPPEATAPKAKPEPKPDAKAETPPEPRITSEPPVVPPVAPLVPQAPPPSGPTPAADPSPDPAHAPPAVPPPPEHPDDTARPQLVEAPKAPAPSAAQAVDPVTPAVGPPTADTIEPQPAAPPPQQPTVLSSPLADEAVAPATPPAERPPERTPEQKRQAEMTARLAAALPFGPPAGLNPFQSTVGAQGQTASQNYRGAVYANFAKASGLIEEARARHLRGQAVVAFSVDERGQLAHLAIAASSGNADIDATALEMIRRAAPFPPPPPGAQRQFSPAIGFGLDN